MRIVFDTNVFIASTLQGGFTENLITTLLDENLITIICSEEILEEVQEKLQKKLHWGKNDARDFSIYIGEISEIVKTKEKITVVQRDPDDNKILECAIAGKADLIISSDQDLIKLKEFRGIAIVHPKTLSYTFPKYFKTKK